MIRHYYISNDLADLEHIERELQAGGIETPQFHVYSGDGKESAQAEKLHEISDFEKSDVFRSGILGFILGAVCALLLLGLAYLFEWTTTPVGWTPFIFLAIVVFGFIAWEAGLRGIQQPSKEFSQFKNALAKGKHLFFLDFERNQEVILEKILAKHPSLKFAGDGDAAPGWLVHGQHHLQRFVKAMP